MKKYNYKIVLAAILAFSFITPSCQDILNEQAYDFVSSDILEDNEETAFLLTNGAIATVNEGDYFQHGAYTKGIEFDSDHMTGGDWAMGGYGSGNFTQDWFVTQMWTGRYALIYRCNKAIQIIRGLKNIEEDKRQNCLGQLYFLKAWAYSQLVRSYGPVPLHKELTTVVSEYNKSRRPVTEVYAYIIELLKEADKCLFAKTDSRYEKGRISKFAAKTLLAQVYVTMASGAMPSGTPIKVFGGPAIKNEGGKQVRIEKPVQLRHLKQKVAGHDFDPMLYYRLAKEQCDTILEKGGYELYENYMDTWKVSSRNGKEFIWQLQANMALASLRNGVSNEYSGSYYNRPDLMNGAFFGMRQHWYELFEEEDLRIKDGVMHRYATWVIGGDGPNKNDPWMFYYPPKDSAKVAAEDPYYGYKKTDTATDGFAILRKFEGVSDRTKDLADYYYPFLRLPIVYLMLAEAECELGNLDRAKRMVDVVRARAHTSLIQEVAYNQEDLRSFILEERAREFALEGVRKWDLLRWGIYLPVMNALDIDEYKCIRRRQEKHLLLPIPISELNANDSINLNNPGW